MKMEDVWSLIDKKYDTAFKENGNLYLTGKDVTNGTIWRGCLIEMDDTVEYKRKAWRVPTDEDAKKRPMCRVKDSVDEQWTELDCELVMVDLDGCSDYPYTTKNVRGIRENFIYCEIIK